MTGLEGSAEGMTNTVKTRLLIVDDERAQMLALCDTLSQAGYETHGYVSASEGLKSLSGGKFDLLLTDLMMPEMDGIALSAAARQIEPELAIILMTGNGTIDTAVKAMQDGALDYVLKPFKLKTILVAVSRALELQRLRRDVVHMRELELRRSKELELANRDLEAYSISISHDLRAPLRAISSFCQMLEEDHADALGEQGKHKLEIIRSNSVVMERMVTGLLEFSRATNETRNLRMSRIDMHALADVAAREALLLYPDRSPRVDIKQLPDATGDPTVLRQVWANLIGNALKYSSKKPDPRVVITGSIEGGEVIYRVQDNGAGFDMRFAARLFGVFQRLHRAEEFAGTGVGLAIVHRIVTRHGGRIWAEGVPNEGASFYFVLPLRDDSAAALSDKAP